MLEVTAVNLVKSISVPDIIVIGLQVTSYRGTGTTVDLWATTA